jgi:hypothetical protein
VGVGVEAYLRVFIHFACEVFNAHLGGYVSHGWGT